MLCFSAGCPGSLNAAAEQPYDATLDPVQVLEHLCDRPPGIVHPPATRCLRNHRNRGEQHLPLQFHVVIMVAGPFLFYPFSKTLFLAFDLIFRPPSPLDFQ